MASFCFYTTLSVADKDHKQKRLHMEKKERKERRTTMGIKFYVRESKVNKSGYAPMEVSIVLNGKRRFLNLPQKFKPNDKKGIREAEDIWMRRINEWISDMIYEGIPLTPYNIKKTIQDGGVKRITIGSLFDEYLEIQRQRIGTTLTKAVYRKYELVTERFYEYVNRDADTGMITNGLIKRFYTDLNAKYDKSTTAGMMTRLKSIITYGYDNGYLKIQPFNGVKITKGRKDITYLNESEIKALKTLNTDNESLRNTLDIFLLMIGTGLSYIDLKHLTMEDIKEKDGTYYIHKRRKKTNTEFTAVILPIALDILRKGYRMISNQKINVYLKIIADLAGIKKRLHCHLARHTYCTILLNKGVNISTIAKAAGHNNTKITSTYYAHLLDDTLLTEITKKVLKQPETI